ncbi:hypothetical protein [Streptomyces sp. NPDC087270]|uniref:hypothetical protein n=1 Tax=Streptomyces sp. NPDC087270 TaxID=3365774 RepID=UPI003812752C
MAVAAVVAGAFTGGWFAAPPDHTYTPQVAASQPVTVTAAQAHQGVSSWPTLGNRPNDRGPGHAAMEILLSNGFGPHSWVNYPDFRPDSQTPLVYDNHHPSGEILFSGTVPHLPHVTLVSTGGELLQYESGPGAGSEKIVYRAPAPWDDTPLFSPPLALNWEHQSGAPSPLAIPPWLTHVQVEGFDGKDLGWRPLKVTDGLSAPVPPFGYRSTTVGGQHIVDMHSDCGIGALIQADDTSLGKPRKVTFVYAPGWPYAVSLTYAPSNADLPGPAGPAPLDQPYIRRMAGDLLCGTSGMDEGDPPASEVEWTQEWHGTTSPDGEVAVVQQKVSYPSGGDYGEDSRSGLLEVGIDKASVYTDLGSNYDTSGRYAPAVSIGCVTDAGGLTVVGPTTATTVTLVDPLAGRHWSGHGHVLKVPKGQLPKKGTYLAAMAVTPGKNGGTDTRDCAAP